MSEPLTKGDRPLVLLIEDEAPIRKFVRASLDAHGFRVVEATSASQGLASAATERPDVVLLDLGLPDRDGLEVVTELRSWTTVPIIVLSARDKENDKIRALDAGADDYLTKPFFVGELLARVRVALRHAAHLRGEAPEPVWENDRVRVDLAQRIVTVEGQEVHLTPHEFRLLAELVKHAGKVLTHRHLLKEVWGVASQTDVQYLRVYMGQLRKKLELDPARPRLLHTEPGIGYRLA